MSALVAPLATSFLIALALTPMLRWMSHRHDLLDRPNERSSHVTPTPRNGGIAILAGLGGALAFVGWDEHRMLVMLGWAAVVACLGLIDDLRPIPARWKLAVQVIAAAAMIAAADVALELIELPILGEVLVSPWVGFGLSLLWVVGLTNAYNFMDGINGIAGLQAIVCGASFAALSHMQGDQAGVVLSLGLAGGAAGFLSFNARGTIFMGDVGSATLGFLLSALALRLTDSSVPFLVVMLPVLPFLFDTCVTFVRRMLRRENLFSAHRTHYYQRLTDLGWSHLRVSFTYGLLAAVCSVVSITWKRFSWEQLVAAVTCILVLLAIGAVWVDRRGRSHQTSTA